MKGYPMTEFMDESAERERNSDAGFSYAEAVARLRETMTDPADQPVLARLEYFADPDETGPEAEEARRQIRELSGDGDVDQEATDEAEAARVADFMAAAPSAVDPMDRPNHAL
jgi:hypothetical protein